MPNFQARLSGVLVETCHNPKEGRRRHGRSMIQARAIDKQPHNFEFGNRGSIRLLRGRRSLRDRPSTARCDERMNLHCLHRSPISLLPVAGWCRQAGCTMEEMCRTHLDAPFATCHASSLGPSFDFLGLLCVSTWCVPNHTCGVARRRQRHSHGHAIWCLYSGIHWPAWLHVFWLGHRLHG